MISARTCHFSARTCHFSARKLVNSRMFRLPTLTAPVFTPMTHDRAEVDCSRVAEYAKMLGACGVRSVFVCGSTGEFPSLTVDERRRVLEAWTEAKAGGDVDTVVAQVGSCCLHDSVQLASHAAACGADAVAAMPPWYFPVNSVDSIVEYLATVAAACSKLPFYLYYFPALCNSRPDIRRLLSAAAGRIPNLAGLKFTDTCIPVMTDCQAGGMQVVLGNDENCLPAMAAGVTESIGIGQNVVPQLYTQLADAFAAGDLDTARQRQRRITRFLEIVRDSVPNCDLFSAMKATMAISGIDLGPPRLPLRRLSETDRILIEHRLRQESFISAESDK